MRSSIIGRISPVHGDETIASPKTSQQQSDHPRVRGRVKVEVAAGRFLRITPARGDETKTYTVHPGASPVHPEHGDESTT